MRTTVTVLASIAGAAVLFDGRVAAVVIAVAVTALLVPGPAGWRVPPPGPAVARVTGGVLLLGALQSMQVAPSATVGAAVCAGLGTVLLLTELRARPVGSRLLGATGAGTVATVLLALAVGLRGTLALGAGDLLLLVAGAALAGGAQLRWERRCSHDGRDLLVVAAVAVAAVAAVAAPALPSASVAPALAAAALLLLAGTVGPIGARVARAGDGARSVHGEDRVGWTVAAVVLALPVVLLAAAGSRGHLPPATWLVLLPTVPAALHLTALARHRRVRAAAARRDALTGLPTEPVFTAALDEALARADRDGTGLAVAFLDLDGFKAVNDRYGHDAGDALLVAVSERLAGAVRDGDLVARRSGDEFLVLLPGVPGREPVEQVAWRLAEAVAEPVVRDDAHLQVRASIGLALWPEDARGTGALLAAADAAMYDAKAAGPAEPFRWCTAVASARVRVAGRLRDDLAVAVEEGRIAVDLEPVVALPGHGLRAVHAEPRWCHPRLGELRPATYLPLVVEPTVARRHDEVVLVGALAAAPHDLDLVVPCTTVSLADPSWPGVVATRLAADGRPARRLELAVPAEAVRGAGADLLRGLNRLVDLGVGVVLTDLGDGPELALRDLAALPLRAVELAAPLVAGRRRTDVRVASGLLALAAAWQLPVRVAGVEGRLDLARLAAHGVVAARGLAVTTSLAGGHAPGGARSVGDRREQLGSHSRDLDVVARALLEGRVGVPDAVLEEVLDRVLQGGADLAA